MLDLDQVALIEERHLQRSVSGELLNRFGAERGDPLQTFVRRQIFADAGRGQHAPVADQHELAQTEALTELLHLRSDGGGIARVSLENLDRNGAAFVIGEQAEDDLQIASALVARMAEVSQRAAAAFEVGGGQIVEHERALGEMAARELALEAGLPGGEPVEGRVELIFAGVFEIEQGGERRGGGFGGQGAGGGELGSRGENAGDDEGANEIAAWGAGAIQEAVEAEPAQEAEGGGGMAVGPSALQLEGGRERDEGLAFEDAAEEIDLGGRPMGEVGEGLFNDFAALAGGGAEEDGRG